MKDRVWKLVWKLSVVVLLVCSIILTTQFVFADDNVTVSISSTSGKQDSEVTVTVSVGNVPSAGLISGSFAVVYDTSKLECLTDKCTRGSIVYDDKDIEVAQIENNPYQTGVYVMYQDLQQKDNVSQIKSNGILCNLVFKIKSGCADGPVTLTPAYKDVRVSDGNSQFAFYEYTADYSSLPHQATFSAGTITVSSTAQPLPTATVAPTASGSPTPTGAVGTPLATATITPSGNSTSSVSDSSNQQNRKYQIEAVLKIDDPNITYNGKSQMLNPENSKIKPVYGKNGALLPAKEMVGLFGGTFEWVQSQNKLKMTNNGRKIEMYIDKQEIFINGQRKALSESPELIENKPYIPLSAAAISMGCIIEWDSNNKTVKIKKY